MNAYIITIYRAGLPPYTRQTTGTDSAALAMAAQDAFGPCGVSVNPA